MTYSQYIQYYAGRWQDGAVGNTPEKADALNHIEDGIVAASSEIIRHESSGDHDSRYPAMTGGKVPNSDLNTGSGNGLDADTVDGSHAGTGAGNVLILNGSAKVPVANLPSGGGSGFDADTVDGSHAGTGAGNVLVLDGSGLVPAAQLVGRAMGDTIQVVSDSWSGAVTSGAPVTRTISIGSGMRHGLVMITLSWNNGGSQYEQATCMIDTAAADTIANVIEYKNLGTNTTPFFRLLSYKGATIGDGGNDPSIYLSNVYINGTTITYTISSQTGTSITVTSSANAMVWS